MVEVSKNTKALSEGQLILIEEARKQTELLSPIVNTDTVVEIS